MNSPRQITRHGQSRRAGLSGNRPRNCSQRTTPANKPKAPVIPKHHKPTKKEKQALAKVKAYPPKPAVPAYCTSTGTG